MLFASLIQVHSARRSRCSSSATSRPRPRVEQATYSLEADQIVLCEYEAGVLPQDIELVRQRISICQIERDQEYT